MKNKPRLAALAVIAFAALSGSVLAAELPKEGSYDYLICFTRNVYRIDHSKTRFAYSYDESGTVESKVPGGLFDKDTVRCVGMTASMEGKRSGGSVCEGVAPNGDKRLTRFWYDGDGKFQREEVGGTGMYDGMVTTGAVKPAGPSEQVKPGIVKVCNHATGTYTLK